MAEESKEDHSLRNGIIAGIVSAVALPVLAWLFGWLGTVLSALATVVRFFLASSAVPRWLVVLLVIASLPSLNKILRALIGKPLSQTLNGLSKPDFRTYTKDVFEGFNGTVWRWRYMSSDNSIWNVTAYCPRCDMQLVPHYDYSGYEAAGTRTTLVCENCHWRAARIEGELDDIENRVTRLIHRKLRTGKWESTVKQLHQGKEERDE